MTNDWDDDGDFESLANHDPGSPDLRDRDPFDLSKALEGAALEHLRPAVSEWLCIQNIRHQEISQKQLKI